ncbi:TetR/AcrR family transcriptional regulator [Novosphingobium taihuense]|uniref:AcrR family transcriptional regulator n=1 Tax=Novosphingobium taihuense TaxID=260085 RepID=A0A7W7A9N1_9SPHN|nr:TetR/AcrR family transcriptional regulator [Novosphingobium taihuense]MBB4613015.1 AcrR family transcriptional regulator [Novosphingobium taihuense]TWH85159.1 TetR family transcriptional regulator [Novosphingobium taihuense]
MTIRDQQREKVVALLAAHLLETGLTRISLRQLAEAAQVSDRMLLYYFPDKASVLASALERAAGQLATRLEELVPEGTCLKPAVLMSRLAALTTQEDLRPVMRMWVEVVAAARREEPFKTIAAGILEGFRQWLMPRLDLPDDERRDATTLAILAFVDGLALIDICAGGDAATRAADVAGLLFCK